MTLTAQAVSRGRGLTAEKKGLERASYRGRRSVASPEEKLITKQLIWIMRTLRNPGVRPGERECLLLLAGSILIDFVCQQHLRSSR